MDPNTMEGALQSAMKIRQAQMDRDRAKFLACTRPMQNSLFHGLYGGGEGGSTAKKTASLLDCDNDDDGGISGIDLLRRDLLEVQDLLRAELVRSGVVVAAAEQRHPPQHHHLNNNSNNSNSNDDEKDAVTAASTTTTNTKVATATTEVDTDDTNGVANMDSPSLPLSPVSSSVAEHRLKVLMCLHSVEKRLRLRSRRCQQTTADEDTAYDEEEKKRVEVKDDDDSGAGNNKRKVEEANNSGGGMSPGDAEAEVECLRLLYLRTVLATAAAFVNRRPPTAATPTPTHHHHHHQADNSSSNTNNTSNNNNNDDSPTNDLSLAIDLLESGYALFGYLTPAVPDKNKNKGDKGDHHSSATTSPSSPSAAPPIVGSETAMERLVVPKNVKAAAPSTTSNDSSGSSSGSGRGMDAIKDDAVSFHSLLDGVYALFDQRKSSCYDKNENKINTEEVAQSRKTHRGNRHSNDKTEEKEVAAAPTPAAAVVAEEPSDTTLLAARLVAHTILTSLASSLSKEEITLLPTTTGATTATTTISPTDALTLLPTTTTTATTTTTTATTATISPTDALSCGKSTTTPLSSLSLLLSPQYTQQQQQKNQQREGYGDEDNKNTTTLTSISPFLLASLRRYAQVGALADICCNLSVCYRREEEGGSGGVGVGVTTMINRRDLEGEEVLEELLMSRQRRNGNGVNHHGHVDILDSKTTEDQQQQHHHTQKAEDEEKMSFLDLVVRNVVDAILENDSSIPSSFSVPTATPSPPHSNSDTPINPLCVHLRSVYLLAKSMGCSISSTSEDARKAIKILDAHAIRPWGALFTSLSSLSSPRAALGVPSSPSASESLNSNKDGVSAAFAELFVEALRASAAPSAAPVVGNDATISEERESSHYPRTHSHCSQHDGFEAIIRPLIPKLESHLVKTIDTLETQFKECVALRASLAAEVSKADELFLNRFQKNKKRAKEEMEKNEEKVIMNKKSLEDEDTITAEDDTNRDETKQQEDEDGEEREGRVVKAGGDDKGESSVSTGIVATASTVSPSENGADIVQTRREEQAVSASEGRGDTSSAGAEAPTVTAARRRREEMEFRLRQEVERARKDLVVAVYGNLFTTSARLPSATGGKESENKIENQKGSASIKKKDGDFEEDEKEEARRRVLRYQPFVSQPADHQKTYRTITKRYTKARSALLDFLARRLFTSVMLPLRCFRVSPFSISQERKGKGKEEGEQKEEGKSPSSPSSSPCSFVPSTFSLSLSSSAPPPPTTIEEYSSWVGLFLDDTLSSSTRTTTTKVSPTLSTISSGPTVGLRKVLQAATLLGLNIVGIYNPREDDFHHPDEEEKDDEEELLEEKLFSDAVTSISSNPNLFTLRQKEFLWESWEVRRRLRTIIFNSQFPTTPNNERESKSNLFSSPSFYRAAAQGPSLDVSAAAVPHRFSLMASGHMHTPEEMAIAQHFSTLTFAEATAAAMANNSPNAAVNERNYFISTFPDTNNNNNNTGASSFSLSPFFTSARVAALTKISFNSLCEKSHNYLRKFLGTEAHDARVSAALEDAQQRRREIVRK